MPEIRLQRKYERKQGEGTTVLYLATFATMYDETRPLYASLRNHKTAFTFKS